MKPDSHPTGSAASVLLEKGARAYAHYAADLLLEKQPDTEERFGPEAHSLWKETLTLLTGDLAVALAVQAPGLFQASVRWGLQARNARDMEGDDLALALRCLRSVLEERLPAAARGELAEPFGLAEDLFKITTPTATATEVALPDHPLALEFLALALEGEQQKAVERLEAAVAAGLDPEAVYVEILLPVQRQLGELWHRGELSVVEEHVATDACRVAMARISRLFPAVEPVPATVLVTAVESNQHEVAVRAVADLYQAAGWRSICLGANTPAHLVAEAVVLYQVDLLVLSAVLMRQVKFVQRTLQELRRRPDTEVVKVLLAGLPFDEIPWLCERLGADGHIPSVASAVERGRSVLNLS